MSQYDQGTITRPDATTVAGYRIIVSGTAVERYVDMVGTDVYKALPTGASFTPVTLDVNNTSSFMWDQ